MPGMLPTLNTVACVSSTQVSRHNKTDSTAEARSVLHGLILSCKRGAQPRRTRSLALNQETGPGACGATAIRALPTPVERRAAPRPEGHL
jgi:hypothetical protein